MSRITTTVPFRDAYHLVHDYTGEWIVASYPTNYRTPVTIAFGRCTGIDGVYDQLWFDIWLPDADEPFYSVSSCAEIAAYLAHPVIEELIAAVIAL